jgi:MoxR-like ATPase
MKNSIPPLKNFLRRAGVFGFDHLEPVILASLVTEDPLLLIGKAGTGKTYLLNSLSEALGLEHKHYNASYLSFDDLIGFPYPSSDGKTVSFIPTPATIWDAESILIDELSRCKPEIQNKFFSIVHEKRIQGILLDKLRYRWAAMNPVSNVIIDVDDNYEGSITLDQALADRFAFVIEVPDWDEMTEEEQVNVIHPEGEGAVSALSVDLSLFIKKVKVAFFRAIKNPPYEIIKYCQTVTTLMTAAGYRISPRRARLMARNFTALFLVMDELGFGISDKERGRVLKLGFRWSLPHRAYKKMHDVEHVIDSVHMGAISLAYESAQEDRWLLEFNLAHSVSKKMDMLIDDKVSKEYKSIAVIQFLHSARLRDKAVFAFSGQPYFKEMDIVNEEAMNELSVMAAKVFHVKGMLQWTNSNDVNNTMHPKWSECAKYLARIPDAEIQRKKRLKQIFLFIVLNDHSVENLPQIEQELNHCLTKISSHVK